MLVNTARQSLVYLVGFIMFNFIVLSQSALGHGMSEVEKQSIIDGGNLSYLWLGMTHMLTGYDHLAFVFGIIFFLRSFVDILKYVTAFTVGHSITLIYATFSGIQMNYFAIDAIIALSVCYIAFTNIDGFRKYLNINPPNMLVMVVALGFVHGFGLSTRLQQLPLNPDSLLLNIISFNVGVELGQVSALSFMLLLIAIWRRTRYFQAFSQLTNYALIFLGGVLFLMQMHGYEHAVNSEEFTLTTDAVATTKTTRRIPTFDDEAWQETITINIPARGEKEYKVYLKKDATFVYSWQSKKTQLYFDFHGEPAGDTSGFFKSYGKGTKDKHEGMLTAPFEGNHGWYWKNNSAVPVKVTLKATGEFKRLDGATKMEQTDSILRSRSTTHETID